MTASPELLHELRASRPAAPASLRARTRELATASVARRSLSLRGSAFRAGASCSWPPRPWSHSGSCRPASSGSPGPVESRQALSLGRVAHGADTASPERAPVGGGSTTSARPPGAKTFGPERTEERVPGAGAAGALDSTPAAPAPSSRPGRRDAHGLGRRLRRRLAGGAGRARPHPLARRARSERVGRDRRGREGGPDRPRPRGQGAAGDRRPLGAREDRVAADHDRRPPGVARLAHAPRRLAAEPDRRDHRAARTTRASTRRRARCSSSDGGRCARSCATSAGASPGRTRRLASRPCSSAWSRPTRWASSPRAHGSIARSTAR